MIGKKAAPQSTMLLPITLHVETQVFGAVTQTVGVGFPGLTNIHNNYQKDTGSFVGTNGKAFHHTWEVFHAALESSVTAPGAKAVIMKKQTGKRFACRYEETCNSDFIPWKAARRVSAGLFLAQDAPAMALK